MTCGPVRLEAVRAEIRPLVGRLSIWGDQMCMAAVLYHIQMGSPWRGMPLGPHKIRCSTRLCLRLVLEMSRFGTSLWRILVSD